MSVTAITKIAEGAFQNNSSLVKAIVPEGITEIGANAFYNCKNLKTVQLPSTLTNVGNLAFLMSTKLETITKAGGTEGSIKVLDNCLVKSIDGQNTIIAGCKYSVITDDIANLRIGDYAFANLQNIKAIDVPANVQCFGSKIFFNCKYLQDIYFQGTEAE